jgi:hypothetical protein
MTPLKRNGRVLVGTGLSVLVGIWCFASGARSDNQRWIETLHGGHRTPEFRQALAVLNQGRSGAARLDECTACHGKRDWISTLVFARPPVVDAACGECHQPLPAGQKDAPRTATGMPWLGKRLHRPAHAGVDYPTMIAGLVPAGGRIACAECHPDHQGKELVDRRLSEPVSSFHAERVPVGDRKQLRMTRICAGCHLPRTPSADATEILREFLKDHSKGDGFDPKFPDALQKQVLSAAPRQALDPALQGQVVDAVFDTVGKQLLLGVDVDPALRGCTPACHGEHSPVNNDGTEDDYKKVATGK